MSVRQFETIVIAIDDSCCNIEKLQDISRWIKSIKGDYVFEFVLVVGGGNVVPGQKLDFLEDDKITLERIKSLRSVENILLIKSIFQNQGLASVCFSKLPIPNYGLGCNAEEMAAQLYNGETVVVGGIGSHIIGVSTAIKLNASVVYMTELGPEINTPSLVSYEEAVADNKVSINKGAIGLAAEDDMPIIVIPAAKEALLAVVNRQPIGAFIGTGKKYLEYYDKVWQAQNDVAE